MPPCTCPPTQAHTRAAKGLLQRGRCNSWRVLRHASRHSLRPTFPASHARLFLCQMSFLPASDVSFLCSATSPELFPEFALRDRSKTWIGVGVGSSEAQEPSKTSGCPDAKSLASREGENRSPPYSEFVSRCHRAQNLSLLAHVSTLIRLRRRFDQPDPSQVHNFWISLGFRLASC